MKSQEEEYWLSLALSGKIPRHIGIIMDGNGRWALRRGLERTKDIRRGLKPLGGAYLRLKN